MRGNRDRCPTFCSRLGQVRQAARQFVNGKARQSRVPPIADGKGRRLPPCRAATRCAIARPRPPIPPLVRWCGGSRSDLPCSRRLNTSVDRPGPESSTTTSARPSSRRRLTRTGAAPAACRMALSSKLLSARSMSCRSPSNSRGPGARHARSQAEALHRGRTSVLCRSPVRRAGNARDAAPDR